MIVKKIQYNPTENIKVKQMDGEQEPKNLHILSRESIQEINIWLMWVPERVKTEGQKQCKEIEYNFPELKAYSAG